VATGTGLLIDVGSSTTDLIPFRDGLVAVSGWTDTERLGSGELVNAGVKRTPVCALAASLPFRGRATGLCAELFATTLDVYLTLGSLREDPDDLDTADGRPATAEAARDRLARMVGADREGFTDDDAQALARAVDEALLLRLVESADRACRAVGGSPETVVASGSGGFLARRVAARSVRLGGQIVELGTFWGAEGSTAACARALVDLYLRHEDPNRARR
jgi:probable H4MPT-linked C1 transfer pathway protein